MTLPPIGQKNYDWRGLAGSELDAARDRWRSLVDFFLTKLPVDLVRRHDTPILNVGCAFGAIQREWMTKAYHNIHGIECVPERAACAADYGCEVTVCDYRDLPMFRDRQFQVVILDRVLEKRRGGNFRGPDDLSELFRVSADQAAMVFLFHVEWQPNDLTQFLDLGWNSHWGWKDDRILYLTLYRGCQGLSYEARF